MIHLGYYNTSGTRTHVRFSFSTHAQAGANIAPLSAFEAADIRVYKAADGAALSDTQRSSSSGITIVSPFDSLVGTHAVDIDLTDNTDSGFWASDCYYEVWLAPSDETIDGQTITGVQLRCFDIGPQAVNVTQFGGTAGTFSGGRPEVNATHFAGTAYATAIASLVSAIWDKATSALTAVGSIGKLLVDNIDAAISSRLASGSYTAPPSVGAIADQVWDEATSGHTTAGSTGKALIDVLAASPPTAAAIADAVWDEATSGHSTPGTTGKALTDLTPGSPVNLDVNVTNMVIDQ